MTQKMSLHRVLSELKLIDKKIIDKMSMMELIGVKKGDKMLKGKNEEEFVKNAKSSLESVEALIQRRYDLKSALIKANATNTIIVNGRTMTIAEAIDYKNIAEYKKQLLGELKSQYTKAVQLFENESFRNNNVLEELIKTTVGNQDKSSDSDKAIKSVTDGYMSRNLITYVDPISIKNRISELQTEIDDFESEVDSILSEANATVFVEI